MATYNPQHRLREPRLLTPAQVAHMLSCSTKTLQRMRKDGDGPRFIRLSAQVIRYLPQDVEQYILKNRTSK